MDTQSQPDNQAAPAGWRRRWLAWRNRVIASAGFQQRAAAFPLTRGVARRRAASLFDLVAGFTYSQVLLAAVESGLLDLLAAGPCSVSEVASHTGLSHPAALRLLRAAAALDLAEEVSPGWYMLGQQGAALHGNAGAQAMIRHHRLLYADLADPLALLRADRANETALARFWRYGAADAAPEYSALMAASQAMVAEQALAAYNFSRHRALCDVGGGHGAFVRAVARRHPALELGIFDLPPVLAGLPHDLATWVTAYPGDFFADALPQGHDCMTLVRILHDHDDAPALRLLQAIQAALPARGTLVIAEPMADAPGARAMGDGYFGLYLWAMGSGRPRPAQEIGAMLDKAGFARWRRATTPQPVIASVIVART